MNSLIRPVIVPPGADEPDVPTDLVTILGDLARTYHQEVLAYGEQRSKAHSRVTCLACGCLCLPDERCPMCQVNSQLRRGVA